MTPNDRDPTDRLFTLFVVGIAALLLYSCTQRAHGQVRSPEQYRSQITREAQMRFGIPAPSPVIAAQIQQESAWNPAAHSPVGASGLMQFMPSTAAWAETVNHWGAVDPLNPQWAIRAGVWYNRFNWDRIKADTDCDRWHFTLSAYNGGLGYVYRRQKASVMPGSWAATGRVNPGITPGNQHENETYSPRILLVHQPRFTGWGRTVCLG